VPWFIGGALLLVLPVAWMHKADEVSYALLVLASLGIMSSDGESTASSGSPTTYLVWDTYKGGRSPLAGHTTDRRCLASLVIQGPKLVLTPLNDTTNALL
jgi:hypothetical protein